VSDRVVRVLPDVPAIDRELDYLLPDELAGQLVAEVGTMVRVPLSGRRVGGWIVATDVEPPAGVRLSTVTKVTGHGPPAQVVDLCRWATWRWAGRLATMMRLASPPRAVQRLPLGTRTRRPNGAGSSPGASELAGLVDAAVGEGGVSLLEVAPTDDPAAVALAAARHGPVVVACGSVAITDHMHAALHGAGVDVARWPEGWAAARTGASVVGGRSVVFAPLTGPAAILVIDEHDERLQSESSPTWNARDVAVERAAVEGSACLLVSAVPSLEAVVAAGGGPDRPGRVATVSRGRQRSGWAPLEVVDRRGEDVGRSGLYSQRVVELLRRTVDGGGRVVCLLNRTGRARLLGCRSCGALVACERCDGPMHQRDDGALHCSGCGSTRPPVCAECGSPALSLLRIGVTRAAEELEALVRVRVEVLTGATEVSEVPTDVQVVIGTEAVLHRLDRVDAVVFLDLDQELMAPRYRAAEEALSLLMSASRLVGGRGRSGRVLVQTRLPGHPVVLAALRGDPELLRSVEWARRELLGVPPARTIAVVGGPAAPAYMELLGRPAGVEVLDPGDGRWLLRSRDRRVLLDHLATVRRPPGRLRLQVDPARVD